MRSWVVGMTLCAGLLAGCSDAAQSDAPPDVGPAPSELTLSVTQWLPDAGSREALIRVGNESAETLEVTGVGLRWSGYGDFVRPHDSEIGPGAALDLKVRLPQERCDKGDGAPLGVVRTDAGSVVAPLTRSGVEFVRALWSGRCFRQSVAEHITVSYGDDWRPGPGGSLEGDLLLRRHGGSEPVIPVRARGSVLYDFRVLDDVVSRPGQPLARLPVRLSPGNRCDDHAIGQATAPYTFRLYARVGDGRPGPVTVLPPPRVQQQAAAMLQRHCARP